MVKGLLKQSERDDAGCLSGIVSIFDFRGGQYPQKLITERKQGSSRAFGYSRKKVDFPSKVEIEHEGFDVLHEDCGESREETVHSGNVRVKMLIEEEMSKTTELERLQSDTRHRIHLKEMNKRKSKKKCNVAPDNHANNLRDVDPTEKSSMTDGLAAFMVQLYGDNHFQEGRVDSKIDLCPQSESSIHRKKIHLDTDFQLAEKNLVLQNALGDVAKFFVNHKLVESKEIVEKAAVQSKEFMDALQTLSSNKGLFLSLIQDPNPVLLKHIQDIQDALRSGILQEETSASGQLEESFTDELIPKPNHHIFSRKNKKTVGDDITLDISKIALLKPSSEITLYDPATQIISSSSLSGHSSKHKEKDDRPKSYFSFKGIKRRLRHVMGENKNERHPISMDGVLDRIPYGCKDSCGSQKTSQTSAVHKKREKFCLKIENHPCKESFICEEDKKNQTEMMAVQYELDTIPTISQPSEIVDLLTEDNLLLPGFIPGNDKELTLSPGNTICSPSRHLNLESPIDLVSPLNNILINEDAETHSSGSNQDYPETKVTGDAEISEASDNKYVKKHDDLDGIPESIGYEMGVSSRGSVEKGSLTNLEMETEDDKPQLMIQTLHFSTNYLHIDQLANHGEALKKPEGPSPVSILEPFFLEDITSPGSTSADDVKLPLLPEQMNFEQHDDLEDFVDSSDFERKQMYAFVEKEVVHGFVTALLQASGLSCYRVLERWNSLDQLLDPSLLEEARVLHNLLPEDSKFLFDCVNDVLAEIQERLINCTSWVSIIKPSSPVMVRGDDFIQEICESIDRHLQLSEFTLHQVAREDLEGRSWLDHQFEIEAVVIEVADVILDEIIHENTL